MNRGSWSSPELWLAIGSKVIAAAVTAGSLSVGDATTLNGALVILVPVAMSFAGSMVADFKFIKGKLEASRGLPADRPEIYQ